MSTRITIGAQVICYINGSPIGQVTGFRWNSSTPYKPLYGLDSVLIQELHPTTTTVSGSVSILSIPGSGNLEGLGVTANFADLIRLQYFSITLQDELTGTKFFGATQCVINDQSWDITPKSVVTGSFSFTGIFWQNEVPVFGSV